MPKDGPIVLLEDDLDDKALMEDVLEDLQVENKLVSFSDGEEAIAFLKTTPQQPFLIICDVNLPKLKGTDFKRMIDNDPELREKSIPFVFYSTAINPAYVEEAYRELTVQGFFKKQIDFDEIKQTVHLIIQYWKQCKHPNSL